jgi:hypothetical protein
VALIDPKSRLTDEPEEHNPHHSGRHGPHRLWLFLSVVLSLREKRSNFGLS